MAEHFDVDPAIVRVAWVVLCFVTLGFALLLYVSLVVIMPRNRYTEAEGSDALDQPVVVASEEYQYPDEGGSRRRNIFAVLLIAAGGLILLSNVDIFWWLNLAVIWPVILIGIGAAVLFGRSKRA